jgi:uncharacterized protein YndB with AHSA1/START domain
VIVRIRIARTTTRVKGQITMHTIEDRIRITATPSRVVEALTTKEGIRGWWTTDVDCDSEKREATFRFEKQSEVMTATFRLDSADERGVAMTCVHTTNNGDWLGTKLVFDLAVDGDGTQVVLRHSGYPAQNEVYANCTKGWSFFITSLKSYIETGKGEPHVRPSRAA